VKRTKKAFPLCELKIVIINKKVKEERGPYPYQINYHSLCYLKVLSSPTSSILEILQRNISITKFYFLLESKFEVEKGI